MVVVFVLFGKGGMGQSTWQKTFLSSRAVSYCDLKQTNDSGYIATGKIGYLSGIWRIFLLKTDINGSLIWNKTYEYTSFNGIACYGNAVVQNVDGSFVVTGSMLTGSDMEIFLMKTNSIGDTIWTKVYSYSYSGEGFEVKQTYDGGYIIAADIGINSTSDYHACLIKTDSLGNEIWSKKFISGQSTFASDVEVKNDSSYIFTGIAVANGGTDSSIFTVSIDSTGNFIWAKLYGPANPTNSIQKIFTSHFNNGSFIIAANEYLHSFPYAETHLLRIAQNGDTLWTKYVEGLSTTSLSSCDDNGFILGGDYSLVKFDSSGDTEWGKDFSIGIYQSRSSAVQTFNGDFITVNEVSFNGVEDYICLIKTESTGFTCNKTDRVLISNSLSSQVSNFTPTISVPVATVVPYALLMNNVSGENTECIALTIPSDIPIPHSEILLSPNPAISRFSISGNFNADEARVSITDVTGREVLFKKTVADKNRMDVELPFSAEGIYFVSVMDGDGKKVTGKIVLMK